MSKFKVGDKVARKKCANRSSVWSEFLEVYGARDYYTVTGVRGDWLHLEDYNWDDNGTGLACMDADNFELYYENATPESWDFAEAARLEQAAKEAIKAYNEYVQRQPKKVYLPMYLPD